MPLTKIFIQKSRWQWGRETSSRPLFCFFRERLDIRSKQVVNTLVLLCFGRPQLGHSIKTNCITFQTIDPDIWSIIIFHKSVRDWFPHHILWMISCKSSVTDNFHADIPSFLRVRSLVVSNFRLETKGS